MFVNYFRDTVRESAFNVAVVRVLLGLTIIWKVASYEWGAIQTWPVYPIFQNPYGPLAPPIVLEYLWVEVLLAIVGLVLFVVGYRIPLTGVVTAFLLAHLGLVASMLNVTFQSKSLYLPSMILLLYALYAEQDALSLDGVRRTAGASLDELNDRLQSDAPTQRRVTVLKWTLVLVAFLYFVGGIDKMIQGPITDWLTAGNMQRYTLYENVEHRQARPLGQFIRSNDAFSLLSAVATIVLETGFLVAIVVGLPLAPFVFGLMGMHTIIALAMNPLFVEQYVYLLLFLPWDRLYARTATGRSLTVVYDPRCRFCARSLSVFESLDVADTVAFRPPTDAPAEYRDLDGVDFDESMYAFADSEGYEGYYAFRELLRQYRVFAPFVWLMGRSAVESFGVRVYRYVADNRSRHFACADADAERDEPV